MNDRELLELAAKAAGYETEYLENEHGEVQYNEYLLGQWNPLTDDGDALRLAAKLNIDVKFESTPCGPIVGCQHEWTDKMVYVSEEFDANSNHYDPASTPDVATATRRAIVRAAAEIGKGM